MLNPFDSSRAQNRRNNHSQIVSEYTEQLESMRNSAEISGTTHVSAEKGKENREGKVMRQPEFHNTNVMEI